MKYFALLVTLLLAAPAFAQVTEQKAEISLGEQNAFVMDHKDADKKMVTKIFEKALKEYGKVKRNKKAKEWMCIQCDVPGISGPTNVYFKVKEGKGQVTSYLFFDDGVQFINSDNAKDAAESISKKITYIGYDVERAVVAKELKAEEDTLKDNNKAQEKLEKKNKELHEDIEKYKKKIAEAEKQIEQNLQDQEDQKMLIEKQIRQVERVTDKLNGVGKNTN